MPGSGAGGAGGAAALAKGSAFQSFGRGAPGLTLPPVTPLSAAASGPPSPGGSGAPRAAAANGGSGGGSSARGSGSKKSSTRLGSTALVDKLLNMLHGGHSTSGSKGGSGSGDGGKTPANSAAGGASGSGASSSGSGLFGRPSSRKSDKPPAAGSAGAIASAGASASGAAPPPRPGSPSALSSARSGSGGASFTSGPSLTSGPSANRLSRAGRAHSIQAAGDGSGPLGALGDASFGDALDALAAAVSAGNAAPLPSTSGPDGKRPSQQPRPSAARHARFAEAPAPAAAAAAPAPAPVADDPDSDDEPALRRAALHKRCHTANLAGINLEPVVVTDAAGASLTKAQAEAQQQQQAAPAAGKAGPAPPPGAAAAAAAAAAVPAAVGGGSASCAGGAAGGGARALAVSPNLPPAMQRQQWRLSEFRRVETVYEGHASSVYKARDLRSGEMVALKLYHHGRLNAVSSHQVEREVRLHGSLAHENIVSLHAAFQEGHYTVMVQEYASGGDLWAFLQANSGHLSERTCVALVLQPFLLALHYLHSRGIAHRDIKPENVLFSDPDTLTLKLADFGLALNLREERAVTRVGTLDYMAPEVLKCPLKRSPGENKGRAELAYSEAVDAWAAGVLTYELLVGHAPFTPQAQGAAAGGGGDAAAATMAAIQQCEPAFQAGCMSELAQDFVKCCLAKRPSDRPTISQLLRHPWIRSYMRRRSGRMTGHRMSFETLRLPTGANTDVFISKEPPPVAQAPMPCPVPAKPVPPPPRPFSTVLANSAAPAPAIRPPDAFIRKSAAGHGTLVSSLSRKRSLVPGALASGGGGGGGGEAALPWGAASLGNHDAIENGTLTAALVAAGAIKLYAH